MSIRQLLLNIITQEICDGVGTPINTPDFSTPLVDLGVDSLHEVQIVMAIEEELELKGPIPDAEADKFPHFDDESKNMADYIAAVIGYLQSIGFDSKEVCDA